MTVPTTSAQIQALIDELQGISAIQHQFAMQNPSLYAVFKANADRSERCTNKLEDLLSDLPLASTPPQDESTQVLQAREQGSADGFKLGWKTALSRIEAGGSATEMLALVPEVALPDKNPSLQGKTVYRIEVVKEDDGRFVASFRSGDDKHGGMGEYSPTPIKALANLCATLADVDEEIVVERRAAPLSNPENPGAFGNSSAVTLNFDPTLVKEVKK